MDTFICRMTTRPVSVKRDDEKPKIRGYGATFYREDDPATEFQLFKDVRERIMPGAFDERSLDVRSLFNHDPNIVLGRESAGTLTLSVDNVGLKYEVDPPASRSDVIEAIERGDVDGSSFWFRVVKDKKRDDGNGGVIWELHQLELREVGPVTFPAYEATTAQYRSRDGRDPARQEIDDWLNERKQKRENDIEQARAVAWLTRN